MFPLDDNFNFLLLLADEFQMDQLHEVCVKHIKLANKYGINALKYMYAVKRFNINNLQEECVNELANIRSEELLQYEGFQILDDITKLAITTARVKQLETIIRKYKQSTEPLVGYLYNRANDGYVKFLQEQQLDDSIFTKCDGQECHKNKKMGQNFDFECKLCRKRIKLGKRFLVNTIEISEMLDRLYVSLKDSTSSSDCKPDVQYVSTAGY